MSPMVAYYLSQTDVARELGVSPDAVRGWRKRYPRGSAHPFTEPDCWTGVDEVPAAATPGRAAIPAGALEAAAAAIMTAQNANDDEPGRREAVRLAKVALEAALPLIVTAAPGAEDPRENPRENSRSMPGWLPSRLGEIRAWRDGMPGAGARTDLA